MEQGLMNRFVRLWVEDILGPPIVICIPYLEEIETRYSEQHRHYHTLRHISHCLEEFELVRKLVPNAAAVQFALWYHDLVYDTKKHDNEERSADRAVQVIHETGLPDGFADDVYRLIMVTKHHAMPKAKDEKFLVDIDLAILGQDEATFLAYELNIRQEYLWVPKDLYVKERKKILKQFLKRRRIYSTKFFRERYEDKARANLEWSIANLKN